MAKGKFQSTRTRNWPITLYLLYWNRTGEFQIVIASNAIVEYNRCDAEQAVAHNAVSIFISTLIKLFADWNQKKKRTWRKFVVALKVTEWAPKRMYTARCSMRTRIRCRSSEAACQWRQLSRFHRNHPNGIPDEVQWRATWAAEIWQLHPRAPRRRCWLSIPVVQSAWCATRKEVGILNKLHSAMHSFRSFMSLIKIVEIRLYLIVD